MNIAVYIWLGVMLLFILAEAATVSLVSVWFIGGALAAAVTALLGAGAAVQIIVFFTVSAALLLLLRPIAKKHFTPKITKTNADRILGKEALVCETVDNLHETGAIRIGGVEWTARTKDGAILEKGSRIRVLSIEGAKVYVEPAEKTAEIM